jgi:benzoyl-CoA reductase subunit C
MGVTGALNEYAGVVVTHTCDGARRVFDMLRAYVKGVDLFFLDIPKKVDGPAVSYFGKQLLRMARYFEERIGRNVYVKEIRRAIDLYNENRRMLERIYSFREQSPSIVGSREVERILELNAVNSKVRTAPLLKRIIETVEKRDEVPEKSVGRKRIFVSGNLLYYKSFLSEIEGAGGEVVGDDFCFGGRYYPGEVASGDDPLLELSKRYLSRIPCGRMENYRDRFDHMIERVRISKAKGVIYLGLKFCDNFLTDYPLLKARLDDAGIPSLFLESEYFPAGTGQLRTRVEAFIEMI